LQYLSLFRAQGDDILLGHPASVFGDRIPEKAHPSIHH
jgi:hypothetical protein